MVSKKSTNNIFSSLNWFFAFFICPFLPFRTINDSPDILLCISLSLSRKSINDIFSFISSSAILTRPNDICAIAFNALPISIFSFITATNLYLSF